MTTTIVTTITAATATTTLLLLLLALRLRARKTPQPGASDDPRPHLFQLIVLGIDGGERLKLRPAEIQLSQLVVAQTE